MKVETMRIELDNGKLVDIHNDYPYGLVIDGVLQELTEAEYELARATWSRACNGAGVTQ